MMETVEVLAILEDWAPGGGCGSLHGVGGPLLLLTLLHVLKAGPLGVLAAIVDTFNSCES